SIRWLLIVKCLKITAHGEILFSLKHLPRVGCGRNAVPQLCRRRGQKGVMGVVGRCWFTERLDCIGVSTRCVLRATEMTPKTLGMIGVEPHCSANPLNPFLGTSEPSKNLTLLDNDEVAV